MKILIVFFGRDYHGGSSYSTFTIAKGLVERGHEVHAYVRHVPSGSLERDLEACGVRVHHGRAPILVRPQHEDRPAYIPARFVLELLRRYIAYPKSENDIAGIIREHGIELVAISSGATSAGVRAAKEAGIPYVWHIREFMEEDHGLEHYPWTKAHEKMDQAAKLICVSKAVEEKIRGLCPHAPTCVVYNGIDGSRFYPEKEEGGAQDAPPRLMISSGIRRSKGTFLAAEALSLVEGDARPTLDIFGGEGGGPDENAKDFSAFCRGLGVEDRVSYHGPTEEIAEEYRRHDALIVASQAEAFGRVTAEAMFCGCAVIGSNSGGTPELIAEERGYLFEPNDPHSLAEAIRLAMSDPAERERRSERALEYAGKHFSTDAYVDKIEEIYRSVLA